MAKKSNLAKRIERSVNEVEQALADENLGTALKWLYRISRPEPDAHTQILDGLRLFESPLYADADREARVGSEDYRRRLDETIPQLEALAEVYVQRQNAGLVLVIHDTNLTSHLTNRGFRAETLDYETFGRTDRIYGDDDAVETLARELEAVRNPYIDGKIAEILDRDPALVISPLLERVSIYARRPENEAFLPESVLIYRRLEADKKSPTERPFFLGVNSSEHNVDDWKTHGVPYALKQNMTESVKKSLNVR